MSEKEELLENVNEYLTNAEKLEDSYNVAVTLYFKAIAVLVDLFILEKEGYIPSNHNERFRLLEEKYSLLYDILDKDFPVYQRSYREFLKNIISKFSKKNFDAISFGNVNYSKFSTELNLLKNIRRY